MAGIVQSLENVLMPIVVNINTYLSNYILVFMLLGVGLWYSFKTKFVQVRCFGEGMKSVFGNLSLKGGKQDSGMSSFQALATAIAAQVGTGNIVGASGAILTGGPGAIFWMWIIPSRSPVTTALKSPTVTGLCISFSYMYSVATQVATVTSSTTSALTPKCTTPNMAAGKSAITTSRMILELVALSLICGDEDTFLRSLTRLTSFLIVFCYFLRLAITIRLTFLIICASGLFAGQT